MTNWNPSSSTKDVGMWVVCTAIGKEHNLIDKMKKNEDGSYPLVFSVGGVELDFDNIAKRINESFSEAVTKKAKELLVEKYGDLFDALNDIQERIESQKDLFKYDWEE